MPTLTRSDSSSIRPTVVSPQRSEPSFIKGGKVMNRFNALLVLLLLLLAPCLLTFSPRTAAQEGGQVKPAGAVFDPCLLPNPPPHCATPPTPPPPIQRD